MAKKALVVGINSYAAPNDLTSGTRDADAFAGVLESVYRFDHVRTLKDGEATKEGFDRALDGLLHGATPNDRLVLYFSGHGVRHERDGILEEALVLQDGRVFDDHELVERTRALPAGILTIVLDCSFGGGLETLVLLPAGDVELVRIKAWIPPDGDRARHDRRGAAGGRPFSPFGYAKPAPAAAISAHFGAGAGGDPSTTRVVALAEPTAKALLVSACLEDEVGAAASSHTNGLSAFTCCLLDAIRSLGPNRSAVELLQATGLALRRLGFRQTPIVKGPALPEHPGLRAFLTFQPVLFVYSPPSPGSEREEQLSRSITEAIRNTLTGSREESHMQTTTMGPNLLGDDISTIVNTVTPLVASMLQSRASSPYAGGFSSPMSGGFGVPFGAGLPIHEIVSAITPVVCALLQSRGPSPSLSWGGASPYGGGFAGLPWGGQQPFSSGMGFGHQGMGYGGMIGGLPPHEIAQIVSAVTPIVSSILQSRGYGSQPGQTMPRAA